MNSRKMYFLTGAVAIAVLALLLLGVAMAPVQAANPGPLAAPTPVSVNPSSGLARVLNIQPTKVFTQDTFTAQQDISSGSRADIQWVIDQTIVAAAMNTATLTFQFSNDGVNWVNGPAFVSGNFADVNDMQQYAMFGRYGRVFIDLSNNNPVTVTLAGLNK